MKIESEDGGLRIENGARILRATATLPVGQARTIVACIVCSDQSRRSLGEGGSLSASHYAQRLPIIARFRRAIERHLNYARFETLRNLEARFGLHRRPIMAANASPARTGGVAGDIIFDLNRFAQGLFAALRNQSAQALQTAGNELFQEIGRDDVWDMPDPVALEFLEARQNLLADVPKDIFDQIEEAIGEGLDQGDSIDQIAKRITGEFDTISSARAHTIASTETGAAYGFARDKAMRGAGVAFKSWLTSHLDNVRAAHFAAEHAAANQRVPLDQPFLVGGERLMFPGDPAGSAENVINCHCVSLASL